MSNADREKLEERPWSRSRTEASETPQLSVVVLCRNRPEFLAKTFDSLKEQTFRGIEVIVVDDCRECDCASVVEKYRAGGMDARRIKVDPKQFASRGRVAGVSLARGDAIYTCDAGDVFWDRETLERHIEILQANAVDIVQFRSIAFEPENRKSSIHTTLGERELSIQARSSARPGTSSSTRLAEDSDGFVLLKKHDFLPGFLEFATHVQPVWSMICRKGIWDQILPFLSDEWGASYMDEQLITPLLLMHAQDMVCGSRVGYSRRFRKEEELPFGRMVLDCHVAARHLIPIAKRKIGRAMADRLLARIREHSIHCLFRASHWTGFGATDSDKGSLFRFFHGAERDELDMDAAIGAIAWTMRAYETARESGVAEGSEDNPRSHAVEASLLTADDPCGCAVFRNAFELAENIRRVSAFEFETVDSPVNPGGDSPLMPAFPENNVTVIFTSDAYYAPYLGVALSSLRAHSSSSHNYDIIVMETGMTQDIKRNLRRCLGSGNNFSLRFISPSGGLRDALSGLYGDRHIPTSTHYRLLAPALLKNHERAVYLDADVLVLADIAELHNFDLAGRQLAACRDPITPVWIKRRISTFNYANNVLRLKKAQDYFDDGVLVMDLAGMRENRAANALDDAFGRNPTPKYHDQDLLNMAYMDVVAYLSPEWNDFAWNIDHAGSDIKYWFGKTGNRNRIINESGMKLLHFGTREKPWTHPGHPLADLYWRHARQTPFHEILIHRFAEHELYRGDGNSG